MFLGLRTLRLGERCAEDARTVFEEPPTDIRGALLQAPQFRLCSVYLPFCGFERGAGLSRYARRRRRSGVESSEGLRRITDLDFCCEFPLESADARGQNCMFLQKKRWSGKGLISWHSHEDDPITEMVTMEAGELCDSISKTR